MDAYHFSIVRSIASMQVLNALDNAQFSEFIVFSMDFLRTGNAEEAEDKYVKFARELGGSAQSKSIKAAVRDVTEVFAHALKSSAAIFEQFLKSGLASEKAKIAEEMWNQRSQEIANARIGNLVRMNMIEDMTWKFGGWVLCL